MFHKSYDELIDRCNPYFRKLMDKIPEPLGGGAGQISTALALGNGAGASRK